MAAPARHAPRTRALLALLGGLAVLVLGTVVACGTGPADRGAPPPPVVTSAPAPSTTPTTAPTTTIMATTVPAPGPSGPTEATRPGDDGPQVEALQLRLYGLGYFLPAFTGTYDSATAHAVMAFQKRQGLARDGVAGPETMGALATAEPVAAAEGSHPHLEVSLAEQVLVVVDAQGRAVAVDATTGAAATPTPRGTFSIFRQVDGWDPGPNGALYRPKYFHQGVAVHGGPPVGAVPASHGCVRIPDPAINWLWASDLAVIGTEVVVR